MALCDYCNLVNICGLDGCMDDSLTYCADMNRFIERSVIEAIKADIRFSQKTDYKTHRKTYDKCIAIIDKHISRKEQSE